MARALIVEILGNAEQFGKELDKAAGKTRQFGKVAGVAGLAIAGGLAYGLEKSVKAAEAAQTSTARLSQAFTDSGQSMSKFTSQIDTAESSSRALGFSNVDVRQSLGSLEIATHSGTQAIKDLAVAQDIARFKGVGLSDASKMLTMAMAGSQRATKQLGLTLQPVTAQYDALKEKYALLGTAIPPAEAATAKFADKQSTASAVIELVSKKLGGQADAFSQTAQGGMAQFHAQTEALQESLGTALLPALTQVSQALATGAEWLSQHTAVAKIAVGVLGGLATVLIAVSVATKLHTAALGIQTAAQYAWAAALTVARGAVALATAAQWAFNVALDANPIGVVVVALAALAVGFAEAWRHSQTFRDIVTGTWNTVRAVVGAVAKAISGSIGGIIGDFQAIIGVLNDIAGAAETAFGWLSKVLNSPSPSVAVHPPGRGPSTPPGRAAGGPVMAGVPYLVGERGPEIFTPGVSGGITANAAGGVTNVFNFPNYLGSKQEVAQILRDELGRMARHDPNIFAGRA